MHAVVEAIRGRMEALGFPVYVADASGGTGHPYVLLLPPGGAPDPQQNLAGDARPVRDFLMVRTVGLSPDSAMQLLERTRTVLTSNGRPVTFDAPGWRVTLVREGSQRMTVDRDNPNTTTGTFPVFVTDEYTMTAVPLNQ